MLTDKRTILACAVAIAAFAVCRGWADTRHVDVNSPTAFQSIQEAIDAAWDFDVIVVHPGVYSEHIDYHGSILTVKGTDCNDPAVVERTILDGGGTGSVVTFHNSEGPGSVLCGLTVRNGQYGVECRGPDTAPVIRKCRIVSNTATGIACSSLARPTVTETTVEDNQMIGISGSVGEITLCTIRANGGDKPGHAGLVGCSGSVHDCVIRDNKGAGLAGCGGSLRRCVVSANGGDGLRDYVGDVRNCLITANQGDGLRFAESCGCSIGNCTIVGNAANGLSFRPSKSESQAAFSLSNSIVALNGSFAVYLQYMGVVAHWKLHVDWDDLWGNVAGGIYGDDNARFVVVVTVGPGNLSPGVDPLFAKRPYWDGTKVWHEGEYHLKSKLGRWDPRGEKWVSDPVDSPCLDRGDPAAAYLDEPSPNGGRIDLGAYGGTPEASKSPGGASCREYPTMDFNHDCRVDQADLDLFMEHWLECGLDDPSACWPDGPPAAPQVRP